MSKYVFCTKCGNKCDTSFKFCNNCGNQLIIPNDAEINTGATSSPSNDMAGPEAIQEENDAKRILQECNMNKIEAIKKYKDLTGKSLKESKADIDEASGYDRLNEKGFFQRMAETASATLKYYGSHPLFSKECKMNLKTDTGYFKFGTMFKQETIPLSDIISVRIETEKEVIERFTATRIALFGPFALAFKKRKVNKTKYLIVECKNYVLTFEGDSFSARSFCERLYTNMINYNK